MQARPAFTYFAAIFALGFVLGAVRATWVAPAIGAVAAVIAELPIMLGASWFAAGWVMRRYAVRSRREALGMGATAFALLLAAELATAVLAFGQRPDEWLRLLLQLPGALGLAGQAMFALMPLLVLKPGQRAA